MISPWNGQSPKSRQAIRFFEEEHFRFLQDGNARFSVARVLRA
jgi:hypothetical protein